MDDAADAPRPAVRSVDEDDWRARLDASRETMRTLRHEAARVSSAIAATERMVAGTLRTLAEQDRRRGRQSAADRREARARDADRFAAREIAEAGKLTEPPAPGVGGV